MAEERDLSHLQPDGRASVPKICIGIGLGGAHHDVLIRAISNVLSTEIAEETYAQIIDGLPLASVVQDTSDAGLHDDHPIHDAHKELCSGVLEKTREFRKDVDLSLIKLDSTLIAEYRAASVGSRSFKTRLVEATAEAIHEIAVQVFNLGTSLHSTDGIASWVPPKDDLFWQWYPDGAWPTLFRHPWYNDLEQYPNGLADVAAFWAESRIIGGVVLFDRRHPEASPDVQPDSVWLLPDRYDITYRIWQLSDTQRQQLLEFLTSETPDLGLLPILPTREDTQREDPEEPIEKTGIYRNIWERKPLPIDAPDMRLKDVWDQFEYPLKGDFQRAQHRAYNRKDGSSDGDYPYE
ncbi:hypothetical protein EDB80DRAFT_693958 [Ilyonectria destructans]|nr:hypothetical protein EDB80DRAFT_693958 [Ilyonectria destructans]